jgi:type IV pilus assembly protein PilW
MMRKTLHPRRVPLSRQRGFNLIELIVAMTIAAFLLAGLFTVLQGTRDTSGEQTALAQLQDNQRLAMSMITDMIQSAGYFPILLAGGGMNSLPTALPIDGTNFPTAGQSITGAANGTGGDTLVVRFQTAANDGVSSCLGNTNNSTYNPAGTFLVFNNTLRVDTTQNALTCTDATGVAAVPLVTGIQKMDILWGVNSSASASNSNCPADTYLTSAQLLAGVNPNLLWTNVCTVRVQLTFTNPLYKLTPTSPPTPGQPQTVLFTKVVAIMSKTGPNS